MRRTTLLVNLLTMCVAGAWMCRAAVGADGGDIRQSPPPPNGSETDRPHWAYRPIADPPPPAVHDDRWPTSPMDQFILARLEERGLTPAPPADKRTLIRRTTFDLTGLPPTPDEIKAFLADGNPDAFARLVDRLLASPRYGERWGRHWLDVARYADSNGLDENIAYGNAWRYRDYVIAAFNADKPFDRFILEQLAGDLLTDDAPADAEARREKLIATGFLSLGPKVLAEVDEAKMEMDIIDEQIDTLGKAIMATTLGCARCHDHKFDPITTRDYYALAGVFKSTRTMEHFKKVARWWENPIPTAQELTDEAAYEKKVAALNSDIAALIAKADAALPDQPGPGTKDQQKREGRYDEATKGRLKALRGELANLKKTPPELSTAMGVTEGKPTNVAIHIRGSHLNLGEVVPRRVPEALAAGGQPAIPDDHSGRLEMAQWLVSPRHPLTARVIVNRVWRGHFGAGLVRTPDNFGRLGEPPTHPLLLDWLARRLMEDGWSIKALHRRIMLSSTYRMSSAYDARAAAVDPTERLHWRAEVHRLQAEAIRDAILAVSGQLDLTMGGPVLRVKNREYIFNHTSKDETRYESTRRSVYLPVIRNHIYDGLALYDFPDSAVVQGNRPTTTVAPQAMLAMNGPTVWRAAGDLATWALSQDKPDNERIERLYERVLGRTPSGAETAQAMAFLERFDGLLAAEDKDAGARRKLAWQAFCQALLASNEFIYVR